MQFSWELTWQVPQVLHYRPVVYVTEFCCHQGSRYVTSRRISEQVLLDARKSNGIFLKTRCFSCTLRLPRTNFCTTVVSNKYEAFGAKIYPSSYFLDETELKISRMAKKGTSSSRILVVSSCILYRSSEGWHDSYLQGHFSFSWAHVHSWGQQSHDTLWLEMLKGAIWCWYCCPGRQWLASGMVCLFLGQQ